MYDAFQVREYTKLMQQLGNCEQKVLCRSDDGDPSVDIRLGLCDFRYLRELVRDDLYRNRQEARKVADMDITVVQGDTTQ